MLSDTLNSISGDDNKRVSYLKKKFKKKFKTFEKRILKKSENISKKSAVSREINIQRKV